ncbi:MAG: glycosyltransferase [Pseudolysinimonas sp.]|uniref:glycosyltransferase family 2 protein n=1 Tax=Pseudolysinimonas sp. TaxID=2680009 RepID=UPI003263EA5B
MPRVTAILVTRDGEAPAESALAAQTRRPEDVIVVTAGTRLVRSTAALPAGSADDWLWFLPGDAAPDPEALARLLHAVEVAPSVVIAGPKLVDPEDRSLLRSFGESVTGFGATVALADDELDQSQHDSHDDVLGVVLAGMLVRRPTWDALGGPDEGLPTIDAGLDLSIRARLAGSRVVRVPSARVAISGGAEDFVRRRPLTASGRERARRHAQLHRRLVYAPSIAVPLHWLSLLPLAVLRSLGLLIGKRPGTIPAQFAATFAAIFDGSVLPARAALRRTRRVGWTALASLRIPNDVVRERRATARDLAHARSGAPDLVRAGFFPGGFAVTAVAAVFGLALSVHLLGARALAGGALRPLSATPGGLWAQFGWGDRDGLGLTGPADPFGAVVATLGTLTPWNPSFSLVVLWLVAPPIAALGAWWCATRLSTRAWPPVLAALLWAIAPPFLAALSDGRPAAVMVHVLLPWLVLAVLEAPRSWSAAGAAGLLGAAVAACSPVLLPALAVAVVVWSFAHPRAILRVLSILLPGLVLGAPLFAAQFARGTLFGLLADPGPVVAFPAPSGWQLLLGFPSADSEGWHAVVQSMGLPVALGTFLPIGALAVLAAVVLLSTFLPGSARAIPATVIGLAGLATAVIAAHLEPATSGASAVGIWPGSGLSLYWAGLVGAAVVAMNALGRASAVVGLVVLAGAAVVVGPMVAGIVTGGGQVVAGDGRTLPAIVAAEAVADPQLGTLVLRSQDDGSLAASVERGSGDGLEDFSTLALTRPAASVEQSSLAELAGNLASRGGYNPAPALDQFGIEFVVLAPQVGTDVATAAIRDRVAEALDAQSALEPVGDTERGSLWRYSAHQPTGGLEGPSGPALGILAGQTAVFVFTLLLALPTDRRRRRVAGGAQAEDDAEDAFGSDSFETDEFGDDRD